MRMKMVCDDRTLAEVANEFLALKKAQKVRERTLNDYKKYIDKFLEQSQNSLDVDVLKIEILEYFADIPQTSPARFNHPYQYLHALYENIKAAISDITAIRKRVAVEGVIGYQVLSKQRDILNFEKGKLLLEKTEK